MEGLAAAQKAKARLWPGFFISTLIGSADYLTGMTFAT
jgi:hypothetical protein